MPSEPPADDTPDDDAVSQAASPSRQEVSKPWFFGGLGITLACATTIVILALRGVSAQDFGYWPYLLILLAVAIFITASLAITEIIPWTSRSLKDWQQPKVLGSFLGLLIGAAGLAQGLSSMFGSPAATEKTVAGIEAKLEASGLTRGETSLVERHINGTWGEPGCQVTYGVTLDKGELTIVSVKSVSGQSPFRMLLKAEPGAAGRLVASVWAPLPERGEQHVFQLEKAGAIESLTWVMQKRETPLRLDRCQPG